jgi:hypothetical protein
MDKKQVIRNIDFLAGAGCGVVLMFIVFCFVDDLATAETVQRYKDGRIVCAEVGKELVCRKVTK